MEGAFSFWRNMNNRKNVARTERIQRRQEAGLVATHFPEVASIAINMTYNQKGIKQSLPRTVNFFPSSHALFTVDCLSKECIEGGFDFTRIITSMIGSRKEVTKGELGCMGGPAANHSAIIYEVAIHYA